MSASAIAARARVLAGYRKLNRARISLFKGDNYAMVVTHQQMRSEFEKNKNISITSPQYEELVRGIDEATDMLLHEVVRGDLNNDTGRYEVKIKPEHVKGSGTTGDSKPQIEPITQDTVDRMSNPSQVEVCKTTSSNKNE